MAGYQLIASQPQKHANRRPEGVAFYVENSNLSSKNVLLDSKSMPAVVVK